MDSSCFQLLIDKNITKTGEYVKELSLSFRKMKTDMKNSYQFAFIKAFVLADSRKIMHF